MKKRRRFAIKVSLIFPLLMFIALLIPEVTYLKSETIVAKSVLNRADIRLEEKELFVKLDHKKQLEEKTYVHSWKKNGWKLIWQDEFNKEEINEEKWNMENWAAEKNNELQFYTPNNVSVED